MFKISKLRLALFIIAALLVGGAAGVLFYGALYTNTTPFSFLSSLANGSAKDGSAGSGADKGDEVVSAESIERIEALGRYLKDNFYRPISEGAIETGLLRGLFTAPGDPYTVYYTKEEFEETMEKTHGELSGVGLTLMSNEDGFIEVVGVIEDSPAYKAGIQAGDLLLTVDGKGYTGAQLTEAVEAAHGEAGSEVVIGVSRDGRKKDYTITRSVFITPTVAHEFMKTAAGVDVGYIRVSSFNDNTAADFAAALEAVGEGGARGVVIDVRYNAGGLVDQAVEMDDMLLDEGVICYAEDGKGDREEYVTKDGRTTELPYAVLIDGTSVSAAEIFALGIKAEGGGKLVGQTTYGKGLIQKLEKFKTGDGARITIMQYVTPDGDPVNGVGIAPDIAVEQPEGAEQGTASDAQLQRALALFG
jgi:carboxyl-terminal processing protease